MSDTPELRPLAERGLIEMYSDRKHSFRLLEQLIQTPSTSDQTAARLAFAAQNTWTNRVDELIAAFATLSRQQVSVSSESGLEEKQAVF